jgi:hypothetical protein
MNRNFLVCILMLATTLGWAQTDSLISIELNQYAKDERFDKFQLTLALFMAKGDTIMTLDYEGTRKAKPVIIKRPDGYKDYAYGYLFFNGLNNQENPGYVTVLVCNPYHKHPHLFLDLNHNNDFTDDPRHTLPYFEEKGLSFEIANEQFPEGRISVLLTRSSLFGQKYEFKKYMDEYYEMSYPGRAFVGSEYTYREQKYIARVGLVKIERESFKIALLDANTNGIYNEPEIDKIVYVNTNDTILDATNPLNFTLFAKQGEPTYFEKNGRLYKVIEADKAGKFIKIRLSNDAVELNRIKVGKKVPKIKFTLARGEKLKLNKFRRKEVYIYFGSRNSKNFKSDTLMLRQIAALDTNNLKVVMVLYVNKSYELRIYNTDAKPNYALAYGTKELSRKMGIGSVPQTLYLGKRRRVKQYGLKPDEFIRNYYKKL